jgi:hypothetical protein
MFVKPARPGLVIRIPELYSGKNNRLRPGIKEARLLPETGADVPENSYWLRRLKFGDVVKTQPPQSPLEALDKNNVTVVEGTEGGKQ